MKQKLQQQMPRLQRHQALSRGSVHKAIVSGLPFDTDWYSVKKEIESARVSRQRRNSPILIEVSAAMDEGVDLADTALWKAAGGNAVCDSGMDALMRWGYSDEEAEFALEGLIDGFEPVTETSDSREIHWKSGFDVVCKTLDELASACQKDLEQTYQDFVKYCEVAVARIRKEQRASCASCRYFCAGMTETSKTPADPADCAHSKHFALLSANPGFPFANGCKFWESKKL